MPKIIHHISYQDWCIIFDVFSTPETFWNELETFDCPEWVLELFEAGFASANPPVIAKDVKNSILKSHVRRALNEYKLKQNNNTKNLDK